MSNSRWRCGSGSGSGRRRWSGGGTGRWRCGRRGRRCSGFSWFHRDSKLHPATTMSNYPTYEVMRACFFERYCGGACAIWSNSIPNCASAIITCTHLVHSMSPSIIEYCENENLLRYENLKLCSITISWEAGL